MLKHTFGKVSLQGPNDIEILCRASANVPYALGYFSIQNIPIEFRECGW